MPFHGFASRLGVAGLLLLIVGFPLGVLFSINLTWGSLSALGHEPERLRPPLVNTASLMLLAVLLAVPAGAVQAFAIRRTGICGRRWLGACVLAGLFVPLPVWAVSWQIIFGEWLPSAALEPGEVAWRPWTLGLLPAAWIHAVAAWPWSIAIVWLVLHTSNPSLEEEARQTGGPRAVFRWVMVPRLTWALLAASCVVGLQAGTEIAITDAMMVRTFAEEVYTQMIVRSAGLGDAIAATIPLWLGSALLLVWAASSGLKQYRAVPPDLRLVSAPRDARSIRRTLLAWAPFWVYLGLPLGALIWKVAKGGDFPGRMEKLLRTEWFTLLDSLAAAGLAGAFTTLLAWMTSVSALRSRSFGRLLLAMGILLVTVPGPLIGYAIKQAIVELVLAERSLLKSFELHLEYPPLRSLLYDQPSPIPGIWASVLRFWPFACGMMAVVLQRIPKSLLESALVEGRHSFDVLTWVIGPLTVRPFLLVAIAIAALAFGEVSAGKLAMPPARGVFVLRLFDQMHYGAESTVAGFCLLQLAVTWGILCLLVWLVPERTP